MIYDECPLYNLKSKNKLAILLGIKSRKMFKQDYVAYLVQPYIDTKSKRRLIEPPLSELKDVQKRIKRYLSKIIVPENVFSGIKGRSYIDNAFLHIDDHLRYLFKIDLTAFFPSISRDTVYRFFYEELKCAPDIANILTNFTTIDLPRSRTSDLSDIYCFLEEKGVTCYNHLISGAPTSQILSYLVNHKMFDELQQLSDANGIVMTIYVDDVTFSSEHKISHKFKQRVFDTIKKYNYKVSKSKVKTYTKLYPKLVTGVIIDASGKPTLKNSLREKIMVEYKYLQDYPEDEKSLQRLRGLLTAARQIDSQAFPQIYKSIFTSAK